MIEFLSSWAKSLGLTIVVVSILEMLLPNNKNKKYIRMVMGIYVIFTMISPVINNKDVFDLNNINIEEYGTVQASTNVDQTSMDKRIEELYMQELEKDITKKIQEKGYKVLSCKVKAQILGEENESKISKIKLNLEKVQENNSEENNKVKNQNLQENDLESKIVTQIQKIKPIDTSIKSKNVEKNIEKEKKVKIENADIQEIKDFLIKEYGVSENCLEIS